LCWSLDEKPCRLGFRKDVLEQDDGCSVGGMILLQHHFSHFFVRAVEGRIGTGVEEKADDGRDGFTGPMERCVAKNVLCIDGGSDARVLQ